MVAKKTKHLLLDEVCDFAKWASELEKSADFEVIQAIREGKNEDGIKHFRKYQNRKNGHR